MTVSLEHNTAILFIEFQNEWLSESGLLFQKFIEDETLLENATKGANEWLNKGRGNSAKIIHVLMSPDKKYNVLGAAKFGLRAAIPRAMTWQGGNADIYPDFLPENGEHLITERTGASAFAGSNLDSYLRNNKIDTIFLCGFATHVCVESTLREAHDKGYTVYVASDATAAFNRSQQEYFFENIVSHFGKAVEVREVD